MDMQKIFNTLKNTDKTSAMGAIMLYLSNTETDWSLVKNNISATTQAD